MTRPQYIIVLDGSDYKAMYEHMFGELSERDDVTFVTDEVKNTKIKNFFLRNKVRKLTAGRLDFIAYEENNLYKAICYYSKKEIPVYVIFLNATLLYNSYLPETLLRYKKENNNVKYILFYLDIMNVGVSMNADKLRENGVFDLVYSIDANDVKNTNAIFWRTFYSKNERYARIAPTEDMYFCGVSKGRTQILSKIAKEAEVHSAKVKLDIVSYESPELLKDFSFVKIHEPGDFLSYPEVLSNELKSSVILEIVQKGQVAPTLRPYEAVLYNRKLLTNNRSIMDFPYWNPNYMQFFERVEDIDWEWVKDLSPVDYKYDGRFSPEKLLDDINERLNEN